MATGIADELTRVLELGPDADLAAMLDVAASILSKISKRTLLPEEGVDAVMAIVKAVKTRLRRESNTLGVLSTGEAVLGCLRSDLRRIQHQIACREEDGRSAAELVSDLNSSSRAAIIASASRDYDIQRSAGPVLCDRRAWVNEYLREQGLSRLDKNEVLTIPAD